MNNRAAQTDRYIKYLCCPLCGGAFDLSGTSLKCGRGHCFDISSKGYVNFVPNQKQTKYDKEFFINRRLFLENGFYDDILEAVKGVVEPMKNGSLLLDAGCGEGYFSKKLKGCFAGDIIAFDLSKDAIKIASQNSPEICWLACDISKIPLVNDSVDILLDMFTPANYSEFTRVLKPSGTLIKVVPGQNHLAELRGVLKGDTYDNSDVVEHLSGQFIISERLTSTKTYSLNDEQKRRLLKMTPMTFDIEDDKIDPGSFSSITIDALILVCRKS